MSKNNTIRKSDKKFIRTQKARIRRQFSDTKKQEELITELYKKFLPGPKAEGVKEAALPKPETKKLEVKKEAKKVEVKKDKKVKAS